MTTARNKSIVRAFVEAVNKQDWKHFDKLDATDFVRHSSTFGRSRRDQLRKYLAGD